MLSKAPFKRTLYGLHHSSVALGLAIIWPRIDFIEKNYTFVSKFNRIYFTYTNLDTTFKTSCVKRSEKSFPKRRIGEVVNYI